MAVAVATAARAGDDDWEFQIAPYVWAPSINGELGVQEVSTELNVPFADILEDLEMAGMLGAEVRKQRWGLLVDGLYMRLSDDAATPGPFFNTIDTTVELGTLDMAIAYRVVEGDRGWIDLLAGARYVNVTGELEMTPDYEAADEISHTVMEKTEATIRRELEDRIESKEAEIAAKVAVLQSGVGDAVRDQLRQEVASAGEAKVDEILDRIDAARPPNESVSPYSASDAIRDELGDRIQDSLDDLTDVMRDAIAQAAKERIDARADEIKGNAAAIKQEIHEAAVQAINELKQNASKEVQKALDKAEKELTAAIEEGMTEAADADISGSQEWVDPYVGVRGRLNLTERTYLGGRADIGGFGVGSELMWQLFGGIGVELTPSVELETGWRYLAIDYDDSEFLMDVAFSGVALGVRVTL